MNTEMSMKRAMEVNRILDEHGEQFRVHYLEPMKNGILRPAFSLTSISGEYNMSPTVYLNDELLSKDNRELICLLSELYDGAKGNLDISEFLDPNYVKTNIRPRLIRGDRMEMITKSNIVAKRYLDMVETLYLPVDEIADGSMTMQISRAFLQAVGIDEQEAFCYANNNIVKDLVLTPIGQMIENITGVPQPEMAAPMLVLSNEQSSYGAAVILNHMALEQARAWLDSETIVILPSSIHEVLCCAINQDTDLVRFQDMVRSVNDTTLLEEELLSYSVYKWDGRELTVG